MSRGRTRIVAVSLLFSCALVLAQEPSSLPEGNAYVRSVLSGGRPQDAAINDYSYDVEEAREANELYLRAIAVAPESPVAEVAKQARSAIANRAFRIEAISQPRPDAVMYCLAAIEEFEVLAPPEIQAIVFEIAALG